jgi:hypothetical protein
VGYSEDMDNVEKGKMRSSAPTKGDMVCGWPKRGNQVAKGDDKKG